MFKKIFIAVFASVAGLSMSLSAFAFDCAEVNVNSFLEDTQLASEEQDRMLLMWWIPVEYWCISTSDDPTVTEDDLSEFNKILKDYTIIAVVDGNISNFGSVTFKKDEEVRPLFRLRDSAGAEYSPLADKDINPDTRSFLSILKPILGNMMGEMGENMHFIVFPANNAEGERIDDPASTGSLTALYDGDEYVWRLPLGSVTADKACPKCGEKCSGAWSYCPYDGTKLQ